MTSRELSKEYGVSTEALKELYQKSNDLKLIENDRHSLKSARGLHKEINSFEKKIDKRAIDKKNEIDTMRKELKKPFTELRLPLKVFIDAESGKDKKRKDAIKDRLNNIRALISTMFTEPVETIQLEIAKLEAITPTEFDEIADDFIATRDMLIPQLKQLVTQKELQAQMTKFNGTLNDVLKVFDNSDDMVEISEEELEKLDTKANLLDNLIAWGVESWEHYDKAASGLKPF